DIRTHLGAQLQASCGAEPPGLPRIRTTKLSCRRGTGLTVITAAPAGPSRRRDRVGNTVRSTVASPALEHQAPSSRPIQIRPFRASAVTRHSTWTSAQIGGSARGYQGLPASLAIPATATQSAPRSYFYASPALAWNFRFRRVELSSGSRGRSHEKVAHAGSEADAAVARLQRDRPLVIVDCLRRYITVSDGEPGG